jgi:UDP-N-acetylmuramoyl-L-alanyl-D-glutamate--2,6-diaminopimelate ligase
VINRDDPGAATLIGRVGDVAEVTYGLHPDATVRAEAIVADGAAMAFTLRSPWGDAPLRVPLLGPFNVANVLAAVATCLIAGVKLEHLAPRLAAFPGVPGRLQRIDRGQPFVVDYAHNADSLAQVLTLLRGVTGGRLIALFGSGGERDVAKRAMMGEVCAKLADFGIFADEDPRGEDPGSIVNMIADGAAGVGWREGAHYARIADRREAIAFACAMARPGDTLILAGKGHEESIIYADRVIAWDEAAEARRALARLGYGGGSDE